jgi:disulfide bond formation protein DsbB
MAALERLPGTIMTAATHARPRDPLPALALIIAAAGAATVAGAWFFQYGLGLAPCPLCLQQRWPYYLAVPLAALVAVGANHGASQRALAGGLIVVALLLLWGAALGVYHAGIEWKWWAGPQDCAGASFSGGAAGDLLRRMQTAQVVRCDEAAWRFLGLSLAGWNVVISLALTATAIAGVIASLRRDRYGSSSVSQ